MYEELSYATHLSIPAVLIELNSCDCENLACTLLAYLQQTHQHIWVKVPLTYPLNKEYSFNVHDVARGDTWEWWTKFYNLCGYHKRISVVLELGESCPLSPIPYPLSPIPYPLSPAPCPLSPAPCPLSPVPCPLSPVPCPLSPVPSQYMIEAFTMALPAQRHLFIS